MDYIFEHIGIFCITFGLLSAFVAQLLKVVFILIFDRKLNIKKMFATGGMPSSHSSAVMCIATLTYFFSGVDSTSFAVATCLALVVMHDAMSVRYAVGQHAKSLNNLTELFEQVYSQFDELIHSQEQEVKLAKLKELLGHSPFEVFMGAIHGVIHAILSYKLYLFVVNS